MRRWLAAAIAGLLMACLWVGCGGGGAQPEGVPRLEAGTSLTAYKVSSSEASALSDPTRWTTRAVATRLVLNFTPSQRGYSTGRYRTSLYNASGSYSPFDQSVDIRAAYTDTDLYLYASWQDHSAVPDTAKARWYLGAGVIMPAHFMEPLVEAATGRTVPADDFSQHLDEDALMVMFPIGNPVGVHDGIVTDDQGRQTANEAGALDRPFNQVGCQAACHAGPMRMAPAAGRVDVWNWKAGSTNALGYAQDESGGGGVDFPRQPDGGTPIGAPNGALGPEVEYDPASGEQAFTNPQTGAQLIVDPMSALLAGHERPYSGRPMRTIIGGSPGGRELFESSEEGYGCATCHGPRGSAGTGGAPPIASFGRTDDVTGDRRAALAARFGSPTDRHYTEHRINLRTGLTVIPEDEIADLAAYLLVLPPSDPDPDDLRLATGAGVPGLVLQPPTGNVADVVVLNAWGRGGLEGVWNEADGRYTIVLKRALDTGHPDDDVVLSGSVGEEVWFAVAITDGDAPNHAGAPRLTLRFSGSAPPVSG